MTSQAGKPGMVAGGAGGGYFLGMRTIIERMTARPGLLAYFVCVFLFAWAPWNLWLFIIGCAAGTWSLKRPQKIARLKLDAQRMGGIGKVAGRHPHHTH